MLIRILTAVRLGSLPDTPQLHVDIDQAKASSLGLSLADVNSIAERRVGRRLRE